MSMAKKHVTGSKHTQSTQIPSDLQPEKIKTECFPRLQKSQTLIVQEKMYMHFRYGYKVEKSVRKQKHKTKNHKLQRKNEQ